MNTRLAAIDIGTNSVLLTIVDACASTLTVVCDQARITRLGEGVDGTRRLAPTAVARTLAVLEEYAGTIVQSRVNALAIVGTSALRDAGGGAEFCQAVEQLFGERPRVIGGLEEAELTFAGALIGLQVSGPVLVFDLGGGSLELVASPSFDTAEDATALSLDVGCVRLLERWIRHDPPLASELLEVREDVRGALSKVAAPRSPVTLVGVAGTVTTLAAMDLALPCYDPSRVHGHPLSRQAVASLLSQLAGRTSQNRASLPGLDPKRADVIVSGAVVVSEILEWSGQDQLVVSDRGLRWGLLQRLLSSRELR